MNRHSEDPDEMPQNVAFHQDLHCLPKTKTIFGGRNLVYFGSYNL